PRLVYAGRRHPLRAGQRDGVVGGARSQECAAAHAARGGGGQRASIPVRRIADATRHGAHARRRDDVNRTEELEAMLAIAREASAVVARVYATDFAVDYKGPADPVTRADREANELICARLGEVFGPVPVVAEESDESDFAGWVGAPRVFFVDPLDGTLEFVAKNGDFVVM